MAIPFSHFIDRLADTKKELEDYQESSALLEKELENENKEVNKFHFTFFLFFFFKKKRKERNKRNMKKAEFSLSFPQSLSSGNRLA